MLYLSFEHFCMAWNVSIMSSTFLWLIYQILKTASFLFVSPIIAHFDESWIEKAEIKFNFRSLMKDIDKRSRDWLEIRFLINSTAWLGRKSKMEIENKLKQFSFSVSTFDEKVASPFPGAIWSQVMEKHSWKSNVASSGELHPHIRGATGREICCSNPEMKVFQIQIRKEIQDLRILSCLSLENWICLWGWEVAPEIDLALWIKWLRDDNFPMFTCNNVTNKENIQNSLQGSWLCLSRPWGAQAMWPTPPIQNL